MAELKMAEKSIILSILVITHNQRELLKRCLDSVLMQKLNVPFEVIVSDDRSDDGTAEYMATLIQLWKDGELAVANLIEIVYTRCNSDDCDPKNVSERCGWNKLNAYQHARGEYFVNVDADDYLKSNDIYQAQLDMLAAHPECSMCMQDVWEINDGEALDKGVRWFAGANMPYGEVLSPQEIITKYRALNQCYMIHRHPDDDMMQLYGKHFDDTIITQHHLQFGPCVYLDRADYVWVRYDNSITKSMNKDEDAVIYGLLPLHHIRLIPAFASEFMKQGVPELIRSLKILSRNRYRWTLSESTMCGFREAPGRVYRVFSDNNSTFLKRIYLCYVRMVILIYKYFGFTNWCYLYGLLVSLEASRKISWRKI